MEETLFSHACQKFFNFISGSFWYTCSLRRKTFTDSRSSYLGELKMHSFPTFRCLLDTACIAIQYRSLQSENNCVVINRQTLVEFQILYPSMRTTFMRKVAYIFRFLTFLRFYYKLLIHGKTIRSVSINMTLDINKYLYTITFLI